MPAINPSAPRSAAFILILVAALCGAAQVARAQEAPDAIVKRVATDVIVGGVSLVTNYRDEFNDQIKNGGVDGLIKTLADRNRGVAAK